MVTKKGITLIEVLIGMTIFGFLLGVFGVLYKTSIESSIQTQYSYQAQQLAFSILQTLEASLRPAVRIVSSPYPSSSNTLNYPPLSVPLEPPQTSPLPYPGNTPLNCSDSAPTNLPHCITFTLNPDPTSPQYTYWYGSNNGVPVIYLEEVDPTTNQFEGFGRVVRFSSDPDLTISNFSVQTLLTQVSISIVIDDTARYQTLLNNKPLDAEEEQHIPLLENSFISLRATY
jgi:prepilin-type N-terminal cleavage/methylation domain-containing protein